MCVKTQLSCTSHMSTKIRKVMNFCSDLISLTEIHVFHISTEIRKFMNFCSGFTSLPEIHVFHISMEIRKFNEIHDFL